MAVLQVLNLRVAHESPFLLLALNIVFFGGVSLFIAILAGRSYVERGGVGLLMLGCGALAWGAAGLLAPAILARDANLAVTVHNSLACLAAACHLAGAVLSRWSGRRRRATRPWLTAGYGLTLAAVALVTAATFAGWMPIFFVQGRGGTTVRFFVLWSAIAMFGFAAVLLWAHQRRSPSRFLYWYALALALIASGLLGLTLQPNVGSAMGWTSRAAQCLGGGYMLLAALAAVRESRSWLIPMAAALLEIEQRYHALADVMAEAVIVHRDGRIIYANRAALRLCGAETPAQLRERAVTDLLAPGAGQAPDERISAPATAGGPTRWEQTLVSLDGRPVPVEATEIHIAYEGQPAVLSVLRDIAERRRGEEARRQHRAELERRVEERTAELRQSQALLRGFFDSPGAMCGIVEVVGSDVRYVAANNGTAALHGLQPAEMAGRWASQLGFQKEAIELYLRNYEKCRATGSPAYFEYSRMIGHEMRWFSATVTHLGADPGAPPRFGFVAMDVTEHRRAEEEHRKLERQMQQAQKLESLGVLAGGIAHDFNNILMAILGNLDIAMGEIPADSPARSNLGEAAKAVQRAAGLCREMLAYAGKGRFVVSRFSLTQLIRDMSRMLEVSVSKKATLRYALAETLPAIEADATQIRQIVLNLVINASEALGDSEGRITISTGVMDCDRADLDTPWLEERSLPAGRYVCLEVDDTGGGIDPEALPRIFDPFFTTKFAGRGLGLAAVQGIVRGHRGTLKVSSEVGKGTRFRVLLPASATPPEALTSEASGAETWRGHGTILLVDDEESIRAVGERMLRDMGFEVIAAKDGREALDCFRRRPDDVTCVLLDLTMPQMDGEDVYRELRRVRPDIRVILSSGYNEEDVAQRFVGQGLAGFLQKPYAHAALAAKLREALEGA